MDNQRVLTESEIRTILESLEEQKAKTPTPIISKNCERSIQIFSNMLYDIQNINRIPVREINCNPGRPEEEVPPTDGVQMRMW